MKINITITAEHARRFLAPSSTEMPSATCRQPPVAIQYLQV